MKLTAKLAQKIADRYATEKDWPGPTKLDNALFAVLRRHGGLCEALNEDARRDLILTLGDQRRAQIRSNARMRERVAALPSKYKADVRGVMARASGIAAE